MALIYNAVFDKNTRKLSFEDKAGNEIYSFIVPERAPAVDDITKPLTFRATQDGSTVKLTNSGYPDGSFQTSRDGGNTWSNYTLDSVITLNTGDEVSFRAKADRTSAQSYGDYFYFEMTGKIEAWHNVMSMIIHSDFATYNTVFERSLQNMFKGCTSLIKAPKLPATTLAQYCYDCMFEGCTSLTEAPDLPATKLAAGCYAVIFGGCTSLIKSPELSATKLAYACYIRMFEGCSSLNEVRCKMPSSYSSSDVSSFASSWLSGVSSTGTFYTYTGAKWSSGASGIPTGWTRVNERDPYADDITRPLTFRATQDGSKVTLNKYGSPDGAFQTSMDDGNTWEDYIFDTAITLNIGEEVSFRAKSDRTSAQSNLNHFYFMMEGKIEALHNVMSLYRTNDFATYNTATSFAFTNLFKGCTSLTRAPALPATSLADHCYSHMFNGCTSLTKAPVLKSTSLADHCYEGMFNGCTSLTKTPALPATTLATSCYTGMFQGCTSLTEAPALPSTKLSDSCYAYMFNGCTSLTKVSELKSTTLANSCYAYMFNGCTSLTEVPAFPATSLADHCYEGMFNGCTSLTKVSELKSTTLATSCYAYMFNGCTSLTEAPVLKATTLADSCCSYMFNGCTSLTRASVLPATTLATSCYAYMFNGCTSLTKAPALPATTLATSCYIGMFNGCTSLEEAPVLQATTLADSCYNDMFKDCSSLNEVRCKIPSSYSSSDISSYASNWLSGVSSTGTFLTNENVNWPSGASGIPTGWNRFNEGSSAVDDITKPLTFRAARDGSTVKLTNRRSPSGAFQTSRDGGNTWTDYRIGTVITLNTLDEVSFRAKSDRTSDQDAQNYFYFEMAGKIEAWHNVMSLYRTNDFATYNTVVKFAFNFMFYGCTSLIKAPVLPATTLASDCYSTMFAGTSLTEAPALPATTLPYACYNAMFSGCTSLIKAPELTATTIANICCQSMFGGCRSLNEVRCKIPSSYSSSQIQSSTVGWLSGVSPTGTFYTNADANWPSGVSGIPTGWTRVNEEVPAVDDITKPLTFRATQDGSAVTLTNNGSPTGDFQTSSDGGNTWTDYTIGTAVTLNTGDEVSFRAKADRTSAQSIHDCFIFQMTGKIEAWHNVMSLYRTNDFSTYESVVESAFISMFEGCTSLTKAPVLPATTLASSCYESMFWNCTSLTKAPALPATTLTVNCYIHMFKGCTSLTEPPELTATTLGGNCYWGMFEGCTSLVNAPALPATTLAGSCYCSMFEGCTSLVNAPALPATTLPVARLDGSCYENMFKDCTSLTKAPALPATTLGVHCYRGMFWGCTSLKEAPELPSTTLGEGCYLGMFEGCTSLTKAPALPTTYTLVEYCYCSMFKGCTSLVNAPALPANSLAQYCYKSMFEGCTSLVKAPALPVTTRSIGCYIGMFSGCSRLNEVRCQMASEIRAENVPKFTGDDSNPPAWLEGVSSTGKFYTNADANWPSGASGIPQNWTRVNT